MFVIIIGVLSDDEKALVNMLFKRYNVKLFNISLSILHSKHDAEDALAQTFLKIMDSADKIIKLPSDKLLPFCTVMVRNTSIDIYRKKQKSLPVDFLENTEDSTVNAAEVSFFESYDEQTLLNAVKMLNDDDRYLLELRTGEDMSYKDIAAILNITEAAARKRFQRAIDTLSQMLSKEGYTHE